MLHSVESPFMVNPHVRPVSGDIFATQACFYAANAFLGNAPMESNHIHHAHTH